MCIANRQFCTEFLKKPFLKKLSAAEALSPKHSGTDWVIQVPFSRLPYIYGLPIDAKLLHCIRELGHNSLLLVNGTALYGCRGKRLKGADAGPQGTPG
jgi:hypothetical protein